MGSPTTIELCGVCGKDFHLPMEKGRRGGWVEGGASLALEYDIETVEDCYYETCCPTCVSKISNRMRVAIHEIRQETENAVKVG